MMPAKYYIYASGRWCEVDTRRGRVAGFRKRARFCYLRGGKLEVGRSAAVLKALRALAAGADGAARDSAPLLSRRPHRPRRQSTRAHHCCSQHLHHSRCDLNANELNEKLPSPPPATDRKRKRSTSEDYRKPKLAKKSATEQTSLQEKQCQTSPLTIKRGKKVIQSLVSSSEDERVQEKNQSPQKKKTEVIVRGKEEEKLVQSLLESSSEESSKEKKKQSPQKKPGPRVRDREEKATQRSSDSEKIKKSQKSKPQKKFVRGNAEEELVKSLLESSSEEEDEQVPRKTRRKPGPKSKRDFETETSSSESPDHRQGCKELVIDDSDVRVLRGFLAGRAGGGELERFDNDEEYKTRVFYKLNPLVVLKRCGPLEQLLLQRLSLKEFARHLGLRSVADVTPEKRYRMRHSTRQARNAASVTSDSENERANAAQPKRRQLWNRDKELFNSFQSSRSGELKVKPQIHRPRDSDSETEVKKHIKRHLERRASTRINPRREDKETKTNKNKENNDSIAVDESSTESNTTGKTSNTDKNRGKSRSRTSGIKDDQSAVVSDENDSDRVKKSRNTRRRTRGVKEDDQSVVVSDETSSDRREKSRNTRRRIREIKENDKSAVVGDETDSDADENREKSRHRTKGRKEDNKSVVVSDETGSDRREKSRNTRRRTREMKANAKSVEVSDAADSDVDENREKSRHRTRGKKEYNKSVVVSDESDSDVNKRRKSNNKRRSKNKNEDDNKSVVISDESDSNSDENIVDDVRTARRTRSQGPEKRVLREHNKSVVISDDTDSDSNENRAKSRTKTKEPETEAQSESVAGSDDSSSNKDDNRVTRRARSKGPDRALKEQNRTDNLVTKEANRKATKDVVESTGTRKITRSSMKGADDPKPLKKADAKKDEIQTTNKKEISKDNKAGPSSRTKETAKKGEDKSVISDSDDAFETPKISPKKTESNVSAKKSLAANMERYKGRFVKRKDATEGKTNEKDSKKDFQIENRVNDRGKELNDKNKDNETERDKSKVRDKDRIDHSNKENSKAENKGKENHKITEAVARNMFIKPVKYKKSSVANGREYTSLEDHAIVAWVSVGKRERMVNGNAVWMELEREYHRLTSQKRTWHSLRNRYLRYILPALGALALPPAQVSRLRAAAAQGSIKGLKNGSRRPSIFYAPRVRSAAAAGRPRVRPGSGPDSDSSSDDNRERTPPPRRAPPASSPAKSSKPPPSKTPASPAKPSKPTKTPLTLAKTTSTPIKTTSTPAKATSTPVSPPRSARLRARPSPIAKKRRIHHL